MTSRLAQNFLLFAALVFSLTGCVTGSPPQVDTGLQETSPSAGDTVLSIVFCAATKGYYEPCPT
jgi:Flp pilus assembly protein TadD